MALGVYVHIPFCLQRCPYCDFATSDITTLKEYRPWDYVGLLREEIRQRHAGFPRGPLTSLYFGGGTPSLLEPEMIASIIDALTTRGFLVDTETEVTLEVNPGTLSASKLDGYLHLGINRFSVGAQTFNSGHLKKIGRRHSSTDTLSTIKLLSSARVNYSLDLLFALPGQSQEDLMEDLEQIKEIAPLHVSPYVLTVPNKNPLSMNRPSDETQVEMFELIHDAMFSCGLLQYELSNYAVPGKESKHNQLYWSDDSYWGIGLSAHSYIKTSPPWGVRFWNPPTMDGYGETLASNGEFQRPFEALPSSNFELLELHEALTDFCHISLRTSTGLSRYRLREKFGPVLTRMAEARLETLQARDLVTTTAQGWVLKRKGQVISNLVFREMTFLRIDIQAPPNIITPCKKTQKMSRTGKKSPRYPPKNCPRA